MIIAPTALPSVIMTVTVVITPSTPDVAAAGRRPAGRVSPPHTAQLTPQLAGRLRLGLHHRVQPQAPHPPPRVPARVCRLPPPAPAHTAAASNSPSASQSPPVQTTSSRAHSYASSPTSAPPSETSSTSPPSTRPVRPAHSMQSRKHPVLPVQLHLRPARYHVRMDRVGPAVAHQRGESRFMLHRRSRSCRAGSLEVSRRASSRQGTAESVEEDGREGRRPV